MKILNNPFFRISTLTLALTALVSFHSCSDDEPAFVPTLPADGGNVVKSISRDGAIVNTAYDWNFNYDGPRLTYASGVIRDPDNNIDRSHNYKSSIKYGDRRVSVSNSTKEDIVITLNGVNQIEKMTVGKNTYDFLYKNGYLCAWQKTVFEDSFGQATQYKSSATITYENEDFKQIDFIGPDKVKVTTTFTPDVTRNYNGLLPETIANEFGCLGFEHLYYAGLFGKATAHLVKSLTVNHPKDSTKCYTLDFTYFSEGNNITLCNYYNSGQPVSVRYSY